MGIFYNYLQKSMPLITKINLTLATSFSFVQRTELLHFKELTAFQCNIIKKNIEFSYPKPWWIFVNGWKINLFKSVVSAIFFDWQILIGVLCDYPQKSIQTNVMFVWSISLMHIDFPCIMTSPERWKTLCDVMYTPKLTSNKRSVNKRQFGIFTKFSDK